MDGKVIKFPGTDIQFSNYINNDDFLKVTCCNALDILGYKVTEDGVKDFQKMNELEVTGIIDTPELNLLLQAFSSEQVQSIVNHMEDNRYKIMQDIKNDGKTKKDDMPPKKHVVLYIVVILIFAIYGIISFWFDITMLLGKITGWW